MATLRAPSASFLSAFLPVVRARLLPQEPPVHRIPLLHQIRIHPSLLPAALAPIPSLLSDLWDGILNAVPKKKTSHMKKRHRQMAGKALKDVTAINRCSACGRPKRAHVLCTYCVKSIKQWFGNGFKSVREVDTQKEEDFARMNEKRKDLGRKPLKWEHVYNTKRPAEESTGEQRA